MIRMEKIVRASGLEYVIPRARRFVKGAARHDSIREAARIELGLRSFLERGSFKGFTTTFEDLHGLRQLPGLAVQRLMADGYGFGAEGDWKTCALLRMMKVLGNPYDEQPGNEDLAERRPEWARNRAGCSALS